MGAVPKMSVNGERDQEVSKCQGQGGGQTAQKGTSTLRLWNIGHPLEFMLPADFLLQDFALFKLNCMKLLLFIAPRTQMC